MNLPPQNPMDKIRNVSSPSILNKKVPESVFNDEDYVSDQFIIDISKAQMSNYYFVMSKFPSLIYNVQQFSIPSLTNNKIMIPRPQGPSNYYASGHTNEVDELSIVFYVDEKFYTYFKLVEWMQDNQFIAEFNNAVAQGTLIILDNAKNPLIRVDFKDILPSSIGEIMFNNQSPDPVTCYCSFSVYNFRARYLNNIELDV